MTVTRFAKVTVNLILARWVSLTYTYSADIPHAVTSLANAAGATLATYTYDANGNMTCRMEGPSTGSGQAALFKQTYNAENRISSIQKLRSGACVDANPVLETKWDFAYDGDGVRTATLITPYDETGAPQSATLTSYYFGGAYEVTGSSVKKYYSFGGQTMMRDANGLQYFLSDHLGSVVAVTSDTGTLITQQRYLPFGAERMNIGVITQTDLGYTGQRDLGMGLMDYHARFYSPYLNRFIQPDSLIPNPVNPQAFNRYSYVGNRPINFNDPSGHRSCGDGEKYDCDGMSNKKPVMKPGPGCGGRFAINCDGSPKHSLDPSPDQEDQQDFTDPELQGLVKIADYSKEFFEAFRHIENYGVPVYKQLRGLGNMTPLVEGSIGFGLQFSHDFKNPNLSPIQKVSNASVIFIEYAVTDLVAMVGAPFATGIGAGMGEYVGGPPGAIAGSIAGYVAENVIVTAAMDYMYWDPFNESLGITP